MMVTLLVGVIVFGSIAVVVLMFAPGATGEGRGRGVTDPGIGISPAMVDGADCGAGGTGGAVDAGCGGVH